MTRRLALSEVLRIALVRMQVVVDALEAEDEETTERWAERSGLFMEVQADEKARPTIVPGRMLFRTDLLDPTDADAIGITVSVEAWRR